MKFRTIRVGFTILTFLFLPVCGFAQSFQAKMDSLVATLDQNNKAMGSVAIAKNGTVLYNKTWGNKKISVVEKLPSDPGTKFRIGSISKMFTAVMIFQLMEEKKLSLETKLSEFFPQLPNAKDITIQHLLSHHSGLHNFTDDTAYAGYYTQPRTQQQMIELFAGQTSDFKPGERAEYSNTNYVLLSYIIEKITKSNYKDQLKKRITDKIGLNDTHAGAKTDVAKNEAHSFVYNNNVWETMDETDMSVPMGAGNIVSTSGDLVKFANALFKYRLINKSSLEQMTTMKDKFGMGIFQFPFAEHSAYGHTGGIDGYHSMIGYFPHDSMSFAFVSNGLNYVMNDIAIGVLSIYYGKAYKIPEFKTIAVDKEILKKYEGLYSSEMVPIKITVKMDGDQLTAQATGQSAFPLDAMSEKEFKFDPAGIIMEFLKEGEFVLKQGGGKFNFKKE